MQFIFFSFFNFYLEICWNGTIHELSSSFLVENELKFIFSSYFFDVDLQREYTYEGNIVI